MDRPNPCLAAGIGAVSLFLLLGGSGAAVAFADPGGSRGSDRGNSSDRADAERGGNQGDGYRGQDRRDGDGRQSAGRGGASDVSKAGSAESPRTRVGSGREDTARLSPTEDTGSGAGGGGSSSGSGAPAATSTFEPPKVTFGNGREPGIQNDDPAPRWRAPSPQPAEPPPPPPPAPPVQSPSWTERIATPPTVARQFVVAPAAELTEPLWGIAGLLLIPAAGAVLGYRQARAAQSAERQNRFSGRP